MDKIFCRKCGNEIDEDTIKCQHCGYVDKQNRNKSRIITASAICLYIFNSIISLLITLSVINFAIYAFTKDDKLETIIDTRYAYQNDDMCMVMDFDDKDTFRMYYFYEKTDNGPLPYRYLLAYEADAKWKNRLSLPFYYYLKTSNGFSIGRYKDCYMVSDITLDIENDDIYYFDFVNDLDLDTSSFIGKDISVFAFHKYGLITNDGPIIEANFELSKDMENLIDNLDKTW